MLVIWNEKGYKRSFQSLNVFHLLLQLGETCLERHCTLYAEEKHPPSTFCCSSAFPIKKSIILFHCLKKE